MKLFFTHVIKKLYYLNKRMKNTEPNTEPNHIHETILTIFELIYEDKPLKISQLIHFHA